MRMRDFYSSAAVRTFFPPQSISANKLGSAVDLLGSKSAMIIVSTGAFAGAEVISVKLQESDTGVGGWTDVAAADVQSDAPSQLAANFSYRLGYLGGKRYIRSYITWTSGTSAFVSSVALLEPLVRPVP